MKAAIVPCVLAFLTPFTNAQEGDRAPERVDPFVERTNQFAIDLYGKLNAEGENVFFSPTSLSEAFGMVAAATEGATRRDVDRVFGYGDGEGEPHASIAALRQALTRGNGKRVTMAIANRMWGNAMLGKSYFLPEYMRLLEKEYGAGFATVDFGQPEQARAIINGWVADRTEQMIRELIPKRVLDPTTALVLTNAIYFKAAWQEAFDPKRTHDMPFRRGEDEPVTLPFLERNGEFLAANLDGAQIVVLPYAGETFHMMLVKPSEGASLKGLEEALTPAKLRQWKSAVAETHGRLAMPRFRMATKYPLHVKGLPELGMRAPFVASNDWKPLNGGVEPLFIGAVFHDAAIEVTEEGTEAAAATAVVIKRGGRPPQFVFDEPFLLFIVHAKTGAIPFFGRVSNPEPIPAKS
ncbi:MAG: serpin family protein [Planctomycetes bacterium]|nr:serpin family protein [Planctomycetota bacterium]